MEKKYQCIAQVGNFYSHRMYVDEENLTVRWEFWDDSEDRFMEYEKYVPKRTFKSKELMDAFIEGYSLAFPNINDNNSVFEMEEEDEED